MSMCGKEKRCKKLYDRCVKEKSRSLDDRSVMEICERLLYVTCVTERCWKWLNDWCVKEKKCGNWDDRCVMESCCVKPSGDCVVGR